MTKPDKLENLYDSLYVIADYLFKLYNPCNFKKHKKPKIYHPDKNNPKYLVYYYCANKDWYPSCCGNCQYLSMKTGCTVKALGCKIFTCDYVEKITPQLYETLKLLRKVSSAHNLCTTVYESKKDWMLFKHIK